MSEIEITLEDVIRELREMVSGQAQEIAVLRAMLVKTRSAEPTEDKV